MCYRHGHHLLPMSGAHTATAFPLLYVKQQEGCYIILVYEISLIIESLLLYHATFFKERNTVAKNLIVVILIFLRVHPIINLLPSRIALTLQIFQYLCVLCFKDCNAGIDGIINDNITSTFPMLFVGIHHISGTGENTRKKSIVEIFSIVMIADGTPEQSIHFSCNALTVTVPDCIEQSISISFLRTVIKPFNDCRFKNLFDFCIRNHKGNHAIRQLTLIIFFTSFGQVSCQIQRTPEIIF